MCTWITVLMWVWVDMCECVNECVIMWVWVCACSNLCERVWICRCVCTSVSGRQCMARVWKCEWLCNHVGVHMSVCYCVGMGMHGCETLSVSMSVHEYVDLPRMSVWLCQCDCAQLYKHACLIVTGMCVCESTCHTSNHWFNENATEALELEIDVFVITGVSPVVVNKSAHRV